MTWELPRTIESIPPKARVCWNCRHCAKWTATPNSWVGRCMGAPEAADHGAYVWLERDCCAYFAALEDSA